MATEESPGSEVIHAVIDRARYNAQTYKHHSVEAENYAHMAQVGRDKAAASRANFEQCVSWLDANDPTWREGLSEKEVEVLDLNSPRIVTTP